MKRLLYLSVVLGIVWHATSAHEYWLEPDSYFLTPRESSPVRLFLGEGLKVEEEMPYRYSKTSIFRLFSSEGTFDLARTTADEAKPLFSFSAQKSGNYLLAMERNWSYITLEPDKFEDYLREDGMEYIIAERERLGESKKEGKERYSRFIKSLIQVGTKRDNTFSKKAGFRLEILPLNNPYALKKGDELIVKILFEDKPLAGRTIFADNRDGDTISKQRLATDKDGVAKIKLDRKGVWLVRLVYMQRCTKSCEDADWESFWGSLSFGVR